MHCSVIFVSKKCNSRYVKIKSFYENIYSIVKYDGERRFGNETHKFFACYLATLLKFSTIKSFGRFVGTFIMSYSNFLLSPDTNSVRILIDYACKITLTNDDCLKNAPFYCVFPLIWHFTTINYSSIQSLSPTLNYTHAYLTLK